MAEAQEEPQLKQGVKAQVTKHEVLADAPNGRGRSHQRNRFHEHGGKEARTSQGSSRRTGDNGSISRSGNANDAKSETAIGSRGGKLEHALQQFQVELAEGKEEQAPAAAEPANQEVAKANGKESPARKGFANVLQKVGGLQSFLIYTGFILLGALVVVFILRVVNLRKQVESLKQMVNFLRAERNDNFEEEYLPDANEGGRQTPSFVQSSPLPSSQAAQQATYSLGDGTPTGLEGWGPNSVRVAHPPGNLAAACPVHQPPKQQPYHQQPPNQHMPTQATASGKTQQEKLEAANEQHSGAFTQADKTSSEQGVGQQGVGQQKDGQQDATQEAAYSSPVSNPAKNMDFSSTSREKSLGEDESLSSHAEDEGTGQSAEGSLPQRAFNHPKARDDLAVHLGHPLMAFGTSLSGLDAAAWLPHFMAAAVNVDVDSGKAAGSYQPAADDENGTILQELDPQEEEGEIKQDQLTQDQDTYPAEDSTSPAYPAPNGQLEVAEEVQDDSKVNSR
jgi:hypothetical protein